jgi:predicted transcriptional regulator
MRIIISETEISILRYLSQDNNKARFAKEIAKHVGLSHHQVYDVLGQLEDKGLIYKEKYVPGIGDYRKPKYVYRLNPPLVIEFASIEIRLEKL